MIRSHLANDSVSENEGAPKIILDLNQSILVIMGLLILGTAHLASVQGSPPAAGTVPLLGHSPHPQPSVGADQTQRAQYPLIKEYTGICLKLLGASYYD